LKLSDSNYFLFIFKAETRKSYQRETALENNQFLKRKGEYIMQL